MTLTPQATMALGTILEGIFYGVHIVLFVLYLVLGRRHRDSHKVGGSLTVAQILLFGLCTVSMCLDVSGDYLSVVTQDADAVGKVGLCWLVIFITIDLLAEMILLYRCWIVWDRRWVIVVVPGLLAFIALGQGFAYAGLVQFSLDSVNFSEKSGGLIAYIGIAAYSISLVVSALTTTLIVTKILLTSRRVQSAPGSNLHRPLRVIAAMLIESGLLMFAFQLVSVVLISFNPTIVNIVSGSTAQIYGIIPSLLNIRVMMGAACGETTEKMASLRFAHSRARAQSQEPINIDAEFNGASNNERAVGGAV